MGKFADLTKNEFLKGWTGYKWRNTGFQSDFFSASNRIVDNISGAEQDKENKYQKNWDWRTQNCVTEVRNQKGCGASYAFASVAAVESAYYRSQTSEKQLVKLSP